MSSKTMTSEQDSDWFSKGHDGANVLGALESLVKDGSICLFTAEAIAWKANGGHSKPQEGQVRISPESVPYALNEHVKAGRVLVERVNTYDPSASPTNGLTLLLIYSIASQNSGK